MSENVNGFLTVFIWVLFMGRVWTWLGNILENQAIRGAIYLGANLIIMAVVISLEVAT